MPSIYRVRAAYLAAQVLFVQNVLSDLPPVDDCLFWRQHHLSACKTAADGMRLCPAAKDRWQDVYEANLRQFRFWDQAVDVRRCQRFETTQWFVENWRKTENDGS